MVNEVSDIEILHVELLTPKYKKIRKRHNEDLECHEYFTFLDTTIEAEYSVGIFWKNKIDDEY